MCTYIRKFSARRYIAQTASVKFRTGSPKWLGMNKFVRTKSPTGCKVSKIFFSICIQDGLQLCTYIAVFLMASDDATTAPNLEPHFWSILTSLRKDSVANYASIWTLFSTSVTGPDVLCNALNISHIRLQVAPQDQQNCGRDFAKRKQSDAEIAGNTTYGYY